METFDKGTFTSMHTWENFELTQCPSLNYFVYSVGFHQVKNYYTFKGWYIKAIIDKKISLVYVVQIFWNLEIVN